MACKNLAVAFAVAAVVVTAAAATAATTKLTMHNLCPYPVWPLVAPDRSAIPSISNNTFKLDAHGAGLVFLTIPTTPCVSLVDGFNVATVVSPHEIGGGKCPALGCAVDLNEGCDLEQSVYGAGRRVVACRGPAAYFRERCPLTRTAGGGVEPLPQHCLAPGEIKLVFCQDSMVGGGGGYGEPEIIRTVVADN
uniref:Thaumatin-like protein n=1 Tax=Leersia perrieri TaxID=77586 RepID=A0A0D9Y0K5_9ORYZ